MIIIIIITVFVLPSLKHCCLLSWQIISLKHIKILSEIHFGHLWSSFTSQISGIKSTTSPHYDINFRENSKEMSSCLVSVPLFLRSHLHTTPPHTWPEMDGDRRIARELCRPNNAETNCCPWVKKHSGPWQGRGLLLLCPLLWLKLIDLYSWKRREGV